jgi:hypothetical protein
MTPQTQKDEKSDAKAAEERRAEAKRSQDAEAGYIEPEQREPQTYAEANPDAPRDPSQAIPEIALPRYLGGQIGDAAPSNPQL